MIKVLKFGGTSVGSAANMKKVAEVVRHEASEDHGAVGDVGHDRRSGEDRGGSRSRRPGHGGKPPRDVDR